MRLYYGALPRSGKVEHCTLRVGLYLSRRCCLHPNSFGIQSSQPNDRHVLHLFSRPRLKIGYLYIINNETTKVKPGIDRIDCAGQVVFTAGSAGEYDEILLNIGFQEGTKFLFLPAGFNDGVSSHTRQDRYYFTHN